MGILGFLPLYVKEWIVVTGFIFITAFIFYTFLKDKRYIKYGIMCSLIVTAFYFSFNEWLFFMIIGMLVLKFTSKKSDLEKVGYFLMFYPLVPAVNATIPLPGFVQLFTFDYQLFLVLIIMLPIFLKYFKDKTKAKFKLIDFLVIFFLVFVSFLYFRETTLTNGIRLLIFSNLIAIFVPYFVITRAINNKKDFDEIFWPMIFVGLILVFIGIFESLKGWILLSSTLGLGSLGGGYGLRGGILRISTPIGGPTATGLYFTVILGLTFYLKDYFKNKIHYIFIIISIIIGEILTFGRGAWVGCGALIFLYSIFNTKKFMRFFMPVFILLLIFLTLTPYGYNFVNQLPWIGESYQGTIDYRGNLIEKSFEKIKGSPYFGFSDNEILREFEDADLRSDQLVVDLVNAYIQIMIGNGYIGLFLFLLILIIIIFSLFKKFFKIDSDEKELAKTLFSIFIAVLLIIGTIALVPLVKDYFWITISLCIGLVRLR